MTSRKNKRRPMVRMQKRLERQWERERIEATLNKSLDAQKPDEPVFAVAMEAALRSSENILTYAARNTLALTLESAKIISSLRSESPVGHEHLVDEPTGTRIQLHPPALGEWLLTLLVSNRKIEALLGDFEERFHENVISRGLRRATWLYWAQVLNSIAPLLWSTIERVGVVAAMTSIARRLFG